VLGDAYPVKFAKTDYIPVTMVDYDGTRIDYRLDLTDRSKNAPKLDLRVL
jgi:hypothetical protein